MKLNWKKEDTSVSWVRRFNNEKIEMPPILVYEFNAIPTKSQTGFFHWTWSSDSSIYVGIKESREAATTEEEYLGRSALWNIKTYY